MDTNVPAREKIAYTGGLLGQNMLYNFMAMYIMFFFTDLLKIPTQSVTIIIVIASLWDAVNDLLMGMVADRTSTRWGKFKPYLVIGPVLISITTILCFTNFGGSASNTVILGAVCYILWGMSYTVCDIPIWAISSVISPDQYQRNKMVTLGKVGGTIGTVIVSVGSVLLLNALGGERTANAYTKSASIIALVGCILMITTGLTVKERILPAKKGVPFKKNIHTIIDNKPLLALMGSLLLVNLVNNLRQVSQMYFALYVWGDAGYITFMGLSLVIGMLFGMIISPRLIQTYDKKKIFIVACVLGSFFSALPFIVDATNVVLGLLSLGFSFTFTGITTIVSTSMLMDAIDYSEWKLGFRGEGIVFSTNTFLNKLSGTIAKWFLGLSMISMHYVENMPINDTVQKGFGFIMYMLPAICFLATILPILLYKMKPKEINSIREELMLRRK
ncbi:glycoside/pentoside/hexuronide transporter [Sphaerochaeta pleomorpha str. Grapes]|uniref:Glycoside/pentoside/hexuronide transporter n=1 Tax=Sphaerochaeta pleomorpha (strain ATCC BAA-1885 / DSM 22778 / Grapes) TaxID=158190 RepID=G8QRP4_SPHPG|nr:glycoside-pentoside-hexuronide (GPH):cation symporter [Sphaerochaeta pleomorpha]AEV28827.1 glycoside/pentoside/hexuronide transporter [Sphaerochaeta pleomorpha str. Grapes]